MYAQRDNAGRGRDDSGGRDLRSGGNHTKGDSSGERNNATTNPSSSSGLMPTPWSTRAQAMNNDHHGNNHHRNQNNSRDNSLGAHTGRHSNNHARAGRHSNNHHTHGRHSNNHNHVHAGRHSNNHTSAGRHAFNSRFPTHEESHQSRQQNVPSFAPASTLLGSNTNNNTKETTAVPPPKLESAAIKGRWADEDSSDDE